MRFKSRFEQEKVLFEKANKHEINIDELSTALAKIKKPYLISGTNFKGIHNVWL